MLSAEAIRSGVAKRRLVVKGFAIVNAILSRITSRPDVVNRCDDPLGNQDRGPVSRPI